MRIRTLVAGMILALVSTTATAAAVQNLRQLPDAVTRVASVQGDPTGPAFRAALGLAGDERLDVIRRYHDGHGGTVTRLQQSFRGVPVWGRQIVVAQGADGRTHRLNGSLVSGIATDVARVRPDLDADAVTTAMKQRVTADFGANPPVFAREKSELVIYVGEDEVAHLAYAVSFLADSATGGHPTRPTFIVDATTGAILFEVDSLAHASADCSVGCTLLEQTGISGSRRTWQYFSVPSVPSVPAGSTVEISITGGSGDADLYVRKGSNPSASAYDCRPYLNGNEESCSFPATTGDEWKVGLYPYRSFSGVTLTARVSTPPTGLPAAGTGPGGNVKTTLYRYGPGADFAPLDVLADGSTCTMINANVKTVDLQRGTTGTSAFQYGDGTVCDNEADGVNGAYSPLNDAHFFGGVVYDMYQDYFGLPPLTFQLMMRVHYQESEQGYQNAFWDGSAMTFGDGGSTFYPLVALDVSAHEVSHGFTEQNSNLIYSGQSGGMNEAFSDMAGEAAEDYMRGQNDWLVGADIMKTGTALRYLCDPTRDGVSIDNVASYNAGLDVHYSSGVYNKAFCTLAKTPSWTTRSAFEVFARANQFCWTPSSTFADGAQCVVDQAYLDPATEENVQDVINAFAVVGINGLVAPAPPGSPEPFAAQASSSGIHLSWSSATGADHYELYRSPTGAAGSFANIATPGAGSTDHTDSNVLPASTYYYYVAAVNDYGISASAAQSATTPPAAPSTLTLNVSTRVRGGRQQVQLDWSGSNAASIDIYRDDVKIVTTSNSGSYTDKPSGKNSYAYRVCDPTACSATVTANFP